MQLYVTSQPLLVSGVGNSVFTISVPSTGQAVAIYGDFNGNQPLGTCAAGATAVVFTPQGEVWIVSSTGLATAVTVTIAGGVSSLQYSNPAVSTTLTNTTTETLFSTNFSIPPNYLHAGSVIRVRWWGTCPATNSTNTFQHILRIGGVAGTAIFTGTATDVANGDIWGGEAVIVIRTIGASGTLVADVSAIAVPAASGTATRVSTAVASSSIDTTVAQVIGVTGTWSVANSGNTAILNGITVEIMG